MTRITITDETAAEFNQVNDAVEVCDESGRRVGYFFPPGTLKTLSPLSADELERRRQQRSGRPLSEILKDLERRS
jgi:hypothetical protein